MYTFISNQIAKVSCNDKYKLRRNMYEHAHADARARTHARTHAHARATRGFLLGRPIRGNKMILVPRSPLSLPVAR